MNQYFVFNTFAHQQIASIHNGLLQYLVNDLFNGQRFKHYTVSTYNKTVQTLLQNNNYTAHYPALCIDPSFPIGPAEMENEQLQQYPTSAKLNSRMYNAIYEDDNIRISPAFFRFATSVTVIMWLDSVFEHFDMQLRMLNAFRGVNRVYRPFTVYTSTPVPYKILTEQQEYTIPLDQIAPLKVLESTGKDFHMLPIVLQPYYKLTDIGDGTEKYGRNDISEIRVSFELSLECDVLTFYTLQTDWKIKNVYLSPINDPVDLVTNTSDKSLPPDSGQYASNTPEGHLMSEETIQTLKHTEQGCSVLDSNVVYLSIYKDQPLDITEWINKGYVNIRVIVNGLELISGFEVSGNIYTLKNYDKGYLLLFKDS